MRVWPLLSLLALLFPHLLGCEGASAQSGTVCTLRIQGAQYLPGELDQDDHEPLPEVHRIDSDNNSVYRGITKKKLAGAVGPGSSSVLVGLQGDSGHWVLPVQSLDTSAPGDFTFAGQASLSELAPLGPATLLFRAVSKEGAIGPVVKHAWKITETAVSGGLVISLDWDTDADLDLRVTAPDATGKEVEIWSRKTSTAIKPGPGDPPLTEEDLATVGRLDFDSNAQCVLDGRRQENVTWVSKPAPANQLYTARVDTFSLCGGTLARWRVRVLLDGQEVLSARGQVGESDTRFDHGPGAGLQALQFTY
jgi:hypothetical protein